MTKTRETKIADTVMRVVVPDFPEVVARAARCRLCLLIDTNPELLHQAHSYFARGLGVRAIENRLKPRLLQAGLTAIHNQVIARHRKHIDVTSSALRVVDLPATMDGVPSLAAMKDAAEAAARARMRLEKSADIVGDYLEAWTLYERLKAFLDRLDVSSAFAKPQPDEDGEALGRRAYALMIWLKLVKETRQLLETISRMRNADDFTRRLLEAHTKTHEVELSHRLRSVLFEVLSSLREGAYAAATARLAELVEGAGIVNYFDAAREAALEQSYAQFRVSVH